MDLISDLIQSLYLASSGLSSMESFLHKMGESFQSHIVFGIGSDPITGQFNQPSLIGLSESEVRDFLGHWSAKNILLQASLPDLLRGKVVAGSDYIHRSELIRSDYYADFLSKVKADHNIGFLFPEDSHWLYTLFISRPKVVGSFTSEEKKLAAIIKPHFETASRISKHVSCLEAEHAKTASALDHLSTGICFLDKNLKILQANLSAQNIFNNSNIITTRSGFLSSGCEENPGVAKLLRKLSIGGVTGHIQMAITSFLSGAHYFFAAFNVQIADELVWLDSRSTRYVLFIESDRHLSTNCQSCLMQDFGLTKQETALLQMLVKGLSLTNAAVDLNVSYETARSHLKSIFHKTNSHSQSQLILFALRLGATH